jgi:hypothetical protein
MYFNRSGCRIPYLYITLSDVLRFFDRSLAGQGAGILILLQEDRNVHDQIIGAVWLGAGASRLGKNLERARSRASGSAAHTDRQTMMLVPTKTNQEKTNYTNKSEGRSRATHTHTWQLLRAGPVTRRCAGSTRAATVRLMPRGSRRRYRIAGTGAGGRADRSSERQSQMLTMCSPPRPPHSLMSE